MRVISFKCFLPAWIAAWIVAVFLPSVCIAYLGISAPAAAIGSGFTRLAATSWKVAGDVSPAVKLMIGGLLLLAFLLLARRAIAGRGLRIAAGIGIGIAATGITMALIPADFSRGFGTALTGARFDPLVSLLYLIGGAAAGGVHVLSADRCRLGKPSV